MSFRKAVDLHVEFSQSCKESDESSLVIDWVKTDVQVSITEVSTAVEFNGSLLEPPLVQGVASTELIAIEQDLLLIGSKELKVFD
ncbi:hypothetical protein GQ457_15G012550 [Hibiscus cannabinus]